MTIHERERPPAIPTLGNVGLRVNGKEYGGWKSATITRGIESVSGEFDLVATDRWAGSGDPWPIVEEDECVLVIGSKKLITGYVDIARPSFGPGGRQFTVRGRDRTGDLVDCSANPELGPWEFKDVAVLQFAKKVAEPYGITVKLGSGIDNTVLPQPPKKLSIDPGDTAFNAIENACRLAGLLPVSDGEGGLVLTRAQQARATTDLVEGENCIAGSAEYNATQRYRTYRVLGQHRGTAQFNGVNAASVKGAASDENVRRAHRTLVIRPEGNVTAEQAKTRAQWEASARAARAATVEITVQGWLQGDKSLWPVNALVRVKSPSLRVSGDMLIAAATYRAAEGEGTTTTLALRRPGAFKPEPVITTRSEGLWKEIAKGV